MTRTFPKPVYVRSAYASCGRSLYMATFHESPIEVNRVTAHEKKRLPTQFTARQLIDLWVHIQFLSRANQWSSGEMRFPSCNFCLKEHLGEPAQLKTRLQFGWAHQPVRTNPWFSFNLRNKASWESLQGLRRLSLEPDIAMCEQGGATGPE
jgi:hypothetical protein